MGRKKKLAILLAILDIIFIMFCASFSFYTLAVIVNILGVLVLLALVIANKVVLKSNWYHDFMINIDHDVYPDNYWYRKHDERNFDLINLGSSSSKIAFDYSDIDIKAMNWAQQPQTLHDDFRLLKNFHSILKKNGVVLISIMPFTSINKSTGLMDALKYGYVYYDESVMDSRFVRKVRFFTRYPLFLGKKTVKVFIKCLIGRDKKQQQSSFFNNPMTNEQLDENAKLWVQGWKNEFDIQDLSAPLTPMNQKGRKIRINLMQKIIDFCQERDYKPIYVIFPMTKVLEQYMGEDFQKIYIYDFLKQVNRDIPVLDYMKQDKFKDKILYRDAYFFNKKGAKLFTRDVVAKLKTLEILG